MELWLLGIVIIYGLLGYTVLKWSERENSNLKERNRHMARKYRQAMDENDRLHYECERFAAETEKAIEHLEQIKKEYAEICVELDDMRDKNIALSLAAQKLAAEE